MSAYLELYEDRWKSILKPGDHEHEVGEPTEDCVNCQLARIEEKFSDFETWVWSWYFKNVNRFTLDTGILADEFRRSGLARAFRGIALEGLNEIYLTFQDVASEKAQENKEP